MNRIMAMATQYWPSALLLSAIKLDLFSLIPGEGAAAAELAQRGGFSPRHLDLMLNALAAHEFLEKRGDRFFNARDVELHLNRNSPAFLGRALGFALDLYEPWGRLHETVAKGIPAVTQDRHLGGGGEETFRFVRAMHERALAMGAALLSDCDFSGAGAMLDLGGGPGTLSLLLTRKFPGLKATVVDLPEVVRQAAAILAEQEAGEEVRVLGGDYLEDLRPLLGGRRFDAVLLSGQMHQEKPEDCGRILAHAAQVLRPGGKLFLVDIMVDEDKTSPRFSTLFGLNMCLMRGNGGVHSRAEMEACLRQAGFQVKKKGEVPLDFPLDFPYFYFLAELRGA
jgi:SAM-dependent methyltransferase